MRWVCDNGPMGDEQGHGGMGWWSVAPLATEPRQDGVEEDAVDHVDEVVEESPPPPEAGPISETEPLP